jgi:hypothetical protein
MHIYYINQKLAPRYFWPSKILEQMGPVSYKLKLQENAKVHPGFHISQLKRAVKVGG